MFHCKPSIYHPYIVDPPFMATPNNIITGPTTASCLRHAFQQQNHFAVQGVREHVLPWPPLSGIDCTQATSRLCQVLMRKLPITKDFPRKNGDVPYSSIRNYKRFPQQTKSVSVVNEWSSFPATPA